MTARRDFLRSLMIAGVLPPASAIVDGYSGDGRFDQAGASSISAQPDRQAREFWDTFLQRESVPAATVGDIPRGTRQNDTDREPFFFFHDGQTIRPALDLKPQQLIESGDLQVTMNVEGFKPAQEDRRTFERLQNAQLRIDVVQSHAILNLIDPMAWTAVAALHPTTNGKLPPLQNLNFDPGAGAKNNAFMLPGGEGRWALNLVAQRKDSFFSQILRQVVPELGRFAPFIGLPGISVVALNSFNAFYGALHDKPESLFKGAPVPVYGTASALNGSGSTKGIPLKTGTYILVPSAHAPYLTDTRLRTLALKNGFIVPDKTETNDVYTVAETALPDVTYATIQVSVKAATISTSDKAKGA